MFDNYSENLGNNKKLAKNVIEKYDKNKDGKIDFEEFTIVVNNHQWILNRYLKNYISIFAPNGGKKTLPKEIKIFPPPFGILFISIVQLIFYLQHATQPK